MNPLSKFLTGTDKLYLLLGMVGLLVYFLLIPRTHPDAAANYELSREEILDRAQGFAFNRGYNINGYEWQTQPIRNLRLLDSLRTHSDNRSLEEILADPAYESLPAYAWEIVGRKSGDDEESNQRIQLNFSPTGELWEFSVKTADQPLPNREALLQTTYHQAKNQAQIDSVETQRLVGMFWAVYSELSGSIISEGDSLEFIKFTEEDAKAIADYYVDKSILQHYTLNADTVLNMEEVGEDVVRVVYNGLEEVSDITVKAEVDITIEGTLKGLFTTYSPESEDISNPRRGNGPLAGEGPPGPGNADGPNQNSRDPLGFPRNVVDTVQIILTVLLGIFTFILFLRRLNARLIDVKGAMQDAIWGGLFATIAVGNSIGWSVFQENPSFWSRFFTVVGIMLAAGSLGAFGVFIISSATDSIGRAVWPQRLSTLTLARNARFFNVQMG